MMTEELMDELSLEPERYELYQELEQQWEAARREFLEFTGGGVVVVFALDTVSSLQEAGGRRGGPGLSLPQEIGVWLHVNENGRVTCYSGKMEVGQNIRTSLTQIIANELPVPLSFISLFFGSTDLCPFDLGTVGSRTTPFTAPPVRKAAAAAREILLTLAAQKAGANRAGFFMENGVTRHRETGRTFTVAELVEGQQIFKVATDENTVAKPATQWHTEAMPKINGRDFVTGSHRYPSDTKRPGMVYGKVLRPPSAKARLVSLNTSGADVLPGVTVVHDGDFVGVVAPSEFSATRALSALHAEWETVDGQPNAHTVFDHFKQNQGNVPGYNGPTVHAEGAAEKGWAQSSHVLEATYTAAYIAHAPIEPRAAVAEWSDGGDQSILRVWTGTQRPFGVRSELAAAFGLSEDRICVTVPDTGSGFGGKHTGDAALEAARLSKFSGKPVKVVWTRDEEFAHAYFRPAGVVDIKSGREANGTLVAWEFHNTNSGSSAMRTPYRVPNQNIQFHAAPSPLRQGSYRALAATFNHFARETHMDELAHLAHVDPLTFRLNHLDDDRLRAVLQAAAQAFGWGTTPPPNHGFGIAGGHEKGSYVANCVEVAVAPSGAVKVVRVVTAFECGAVMNQNNVRAQVEGAVVMGLGGALFEQIDFENGQVLSHCFSKYRVPRFSDIPPLETVLLDRPDLVSVGAGETPIVAIAPAIGNALFQATGIRLRALPLAPHGVKL